ncbi:RUS family member 1 [Anthonomus grandis grandis]|uniref:RUS family member 1 n=1 Tax=Anthonomus grandis grandis TaxID=2921223 RepID=UPI002165B639|nr:RUS family member 1 [Anthonomus grandis grandis]
MPDTDIVATERCGSTGEIVSYVRRRNNVIQVKPPKRFLHNFKGITQFFKEIILPYGYPESVSDDYLEYQIWDTFQAFCSTIIGAFKTRAVLKGVGVGDSTANAASAAITWILKDGIGMFGRILFTWWKGSGLDCDCKKWRFFADILNDLAMFVELCLPFYTSVSMQVLCITSTMYAIVGVTGGATRASITHHQAIKDNMAEISAKDGSQETIVNLIGSFGSIFLLNYFTSSKAEWILILLLMILHLYTNFLAVKSLVFKTFNKERLALVLKAYFTIGTVMNPFKINVKESALVGCGFKVKRMCGFDIVLGDSLKNALTIYSATDLKQLQTVYGDKKYFLFVNGKKRRIYVCLEKGETTEDVIAAYFHAVCLGLATSIYNNIPLEIYSKRQLHHPTPITRLYTYMKSFEKFNNFKNITPNLLIDFNEFVRQEHSMFFTALRINGWRLDSHCLQTSEYRIDWKHESTSKKAL